MYVKLLRDNPGTKLVLSGAHHSSQIRPILRLFFCNKGCTATWTWLRSVQEKLEAAYSQSAAKHADTFWGLAWQGEIDALRKMANEKPDHVAAVVNAYTLCCTPLHAAIQRNHLEVAKFLLDNGADPDLMTGLGVCPLDLAVFAGDLNLAIMLLSRQASVNRADKDGNTLATLAAYNGDFDMLHTLVDNGASTIRCNNRGMDTEDVLYTVHGKTLVQALSEGATMRAQQATDQRALRYIEMGWGTGALLPLAEAEELVRETGMLDRADTPGLWLQVAIEAAHVTRETPPMPDSPAADDADSPSQPETDPPEPTLGFEQFLNAYQRFMRAKTDHPHICTGLDESTGSEKVSFMSSIRDFEKGDATTLPFSQRLIDYTNNKIKAVYASDSSDALRLLWGDHSDTVLDAEGTKVENLRRQLQQEYKESFPESDRHFENVRIRLATVQSVTQISVLPGELDDAETDLFEIGLVVAKHLRNEVRTSKRRWRTQAAELFERIDKAKSEKAALTALHLASDTMETAEKKEFDQYHRNMDLPTSYELMRACKSNNWRRIREILARVHIAEKKHVVKRANVNEMARDGYSALMVAVCYGNLRAIRELIAAGANVDQLASDFSTSLLIAADEGNWRVVQALLNGGANCNHALPNGATALHLAALCDYHKVVKVLLSAAPPTCCKCNVNKAAVGGLSALHLAAHEGHSECIRLLVKAPGIDLNQPSDAGATPLLVAVKMGKYDAAQVLLEAGVAVNAGGDENVKTLPYLSVAVAQGDYWLTHLLLEHGAKPDLVRGRDGNSEAMVSAIAGDFDIMHLLIAEHGASTTAKNDNGEDVTAILDKLYHITLEEAMDFGSEMEKPPKGKMMTYVDKEISRQVFHNAIGVDETVVTPRTSARHKLTFCFTKASFRQMLVEMGMLGRLETVGRTDAILDLIADSAEEQSREKFRLGFHQFQLLFRQLRRLLLFEDNVHNSVASQKRHKKYANASASGGHVEAVVGSFLENDDKLWSL